MFENPSFTFWNVVYTAIGAAVFWSTWGRTKLKPYGLSELIRYLPFEQYHPIIEFLVFVALGVVIGIGFTSPTNPRQAISAGLGWTGVFARRKNAVK
jgi:hypothetical protein